jgi:cell division protein FtsN
MTRHSQRGGTFLGFIIGLVLGLGVALAVAIYVTKVPTPFSNKNQPRSPAQDVQETEKNKDWNPNSVLQPKLPAPSPAETNATAPGELGSNPSALPAATGQTVPTPAVSADPLGDWVKTKTGQGDAAAPADADGSFVYMVQAGAYRNRSDADALKAQLALLGLDATVSPREQAGRVVFRVRLGPFDNKKDAERVRTLLQSNNQENTLVRVQR